MKKFEIVRILKMWHRDTHWTNVVGKTVLKNCLTKGCHKSLTCKNSLSEKHLPGFFSD